MPLFIDLALSLPALAILQIAMIIIFLLYGIAKFASYEQKAIGTLVSKHPVLRHGPKVLGEAGFARLLGTVELLTAALLTVGLIASPFGLIGGLLGAATFVVTLSIIPFVQYFEAGLGRAFLSSRGQFLVKDLVLLGGCLTIAQHHAILL